MARTTVPKASLSNVKLDEISFVGKGDNPGAHVLLLKIKKDGIVALGKEYQGEDKASLLTKWLKDFRKDDAQTFEQIIQNEELRDEVWNMVWTLEDSIGSIMRDGSVTDKTAMLQQTIEQFKNAISEITKGGTENMPEKLKKELEEAGVKVTELEKTNADLIKENETLKAATGTTEDGTCKTCGAKTKKEAEIDKSALPEAVRKHLEDLEKSNKDNAEAIAKMLDDGLTREYLAKAAEVGNIGKADEIGSILKDIAKIKPELADKIHGLLKTADARIQEGGLLTEVGKVKTGDNATAYDQMMAKATELKKTKPELSIQKAFTIVYDSEHELRKQHITETRTTIQE